MIALAAAPLFLISVMSQKFDDAHMKLGPFAWIADADIAMGATTNVFYTKEGDKFGFFNQGTARMAGRIQNSLLTHHHWVEAPYEFFPQYSNQTHYDPNFGADFILHPHEKISTTFSYKYTMLSDAATSVDSERVKHHDQIAVVDAEYGSPESEYTLRGVVRMFRTGYEDDFDHNSHTKYEFDGWLKKPIYPESLVGFLLSGRVYRYDQFKTVGVFQHENSRWVEGAGGFEGTIGQSATLMAYFGMQMALYDTTGYNLEPYLDITIAERLSGTSTITAGFKSRLDNSSYSNLARTTTLFVHGYQIFFDSWMVTLDGDFTLRQFIHGGGNRTDHFMGLKVRMDVPWRKILSFYLEGKMLFNLSDALAETAALSTGEDRYASYNKIDGMIGVTSQF